MKHSCGGKYKLLNVHVYNSPPPTTTTDTTKLFHITLVSSACLLRLVSYVKTAICQQSLNPTRLAPNNPTISLPRGSSDFNPI
ncbi:hypothetical protein EYF80_046221 [Liparis tanakae]|uniref:Uncharacterized protein n=1 Tax=Liparis tanakae TaxID=230148 RepID=A0A4Z2FS61_9TELE|nr:hypothetical protein EYF80_046221 [Liparis tanakae]